MANVKVRINRTEMAQLLSSSEMRRELESRAFVITATAVPYSGVDTGRLITSMSHRVEPADGRLVAVLGSGAGDNVDSVSYASWHWADRPDPAARPERDEIRGRSVPHPTKPAPTRPYTHALEDLGVEYTVKGFEA